MAKASEHPDYPSVYPYSDRHGKTRWRFRRSGTDKSLPGEPHSPAFDAAYNAIVEGRPTTAEIIPLEGGGFRPKTLKHAYMILKSSAKQQEPAPLRPRDRAAVAPQREGRPGDRWRRPS
jgi:hypothetical protein